MSGNKFEKENDLKIHVGVVDFIIYTVNKLGICKRVESRLYISLSLFTVSDIFNRLILDYFVARIHI